MTLNDYYNRLDQTTRKFIARAYADAIRQLATAEHPALSSDNADETSRLLCWRIVSRSSCGIRDLKDLKAYAVAGIDPQILLRRLKVIRLSFETKLIRYEQLKDCIAAPGKFNRSSLCAVVNDARNDLTETKKAYVRLLVLWAEEPWRRQIFGAAPQRRIGLVLQ